jgi:hypothetical protein
MTPRFGGEQCPNLWFRICLHPINGGVNPLATEIWPAGRLNKQNRARPAVLAVSVLSVASASVTLVVSVVSVLSDYADSPVDTPEGHLLPFVTHAERAAADAGGDPRKINLSVDFLRSTSVNDRRKSTYNSIFETCD